MYSPDFLIRFLNSKTNWETLQVSDDILDKSHKIPANKITLTWSKEPLIDHINLVVL